MSEEESTNMVKGTIEAATGLVKAVPIYEDAIQPVAKQVGKSLEIVGKAVNAALMPIQGLVWGAETIQTFLKDTLSQKLLELMLDTRSYSRLINGCLQKTDCLTD